MAEPTPVAWATVQDVKKLTRQDVEQDDIDAAVATIEIHIGLIQDVVRPGISDRDRYWLKLATAYQTVWLRAQADAFERNDVESASQDGESANFRRDAHTLGPMARKAIKRLSWRGPRTLNTPRGQTRRVDVTSEEYDDSLPWEAV